MKHVVHTNTSNNRGMVLIGVLLLLVMISVLAFTLNRKAGMQNRMAGNHVLSVRQLEGQGAAVEDAIWQLTRDPMYRTTGEVFTFDGMTFTRKIENSWVTGFEDAVTIQVSVPGGVTRRSAAFRYYLYDLHSIVKPIQICADAWGDLYVADEDNHCIWKVNGISGAITRFAGTGSSGFSGDGGPATAAKLKKPQAVWVGPTGAIYIADKDNHRVRRVDLAGTITTVAGTGSSGYNGDGILAVNAELKKPYGIFVDSNENLYIADRDNNRIRKVDGSSGLISTVAGTGSKSYSGEGGPATNAKFNHPEGVFVHSDGDIYIADKNNCMVRKVEADDGNVYRVAGAVDEGEEDEEDMIKCGSGTYGGDQKLDKPTQISVAPNGDLYIADKDNCVIRKKDAISGNVSIVVGTNNSCDFTGDGGSSTAAELDKPRGVFIKPDSAIIVSDTNNACLRSVDTGGIILTLTARDNPALDKPRHAALDLNGDVLIADTDNHRIRKIEVDSFKVTTIAGTGNGNYSGDGGPATSARLKKPRGIDVAPSSGNIYIADTENHVIRRVNASDGKIILTAGIPENSGYNGEYINQFLVELDKPNDVAIDDDLIYYADTENHRVRLLDWPTKLVHTVAGDGNGDHGGDGGPATSAKLNKPRGICLDADGDIYIADTDNHVIRKVDIGTGIITTVAGRPKNSGYSGDGGTATNAKLKNPEDVWVDAAGNIFIVDTENHAIRVVSAHNGKIYTLAGIGNSGFNGDDQPAIQAQLSKPNGIAMDDKRGGLQIYISDRENSRLRMLRLKKIVELY